MAYALTINSPATSNGALGRARDAVARYRTYRETVSELRALNDRELADLGIVRANVRDVARSAVYGL